MNKYIASCISNLEQIAIREIKELIKASPTILIPSRLLIETSEKEIQNLIYQTRSLIYIYELIAQGDITSIADIKAIIKNTNFKKIIKQNFVVKCERQGKHDFKSIDVEKEIGAFIHENTNMPVNLQNPTTTIFIDIINEHCIIGIDLTGIKLSKRDYRIKLTSSSINPCIAYSLIRFAGWKKTESLLDPFTKSGEIPIEAALYALNISPQKHIKDKLLIAKLQKFNPKDQEKPAKLKIFAADSLMPSIRSTEINAKLAGVNKSINYTRTELEGLDLKFKKSSIDKIITSPPQISQNHPTKQLDNIYSAFFKSASIILKKTSTITLLSNRHLELINKYSAEFKFKIIKQLSFTHGNNEYIVIQLKR